MFKNRFLPVTLVLLLQIKVQALVYPGHLRIDINAPKTRFTATEIVQLNVVLTNQHNREHSVITPGNQSTGNKLIYFSWYKTDTNMQLTEVYRDERTILMDTGVKGYHSSKYLQENESLQLCFLLNDTQNAKRHIYSSYRTPNLPPGKYKIKAWYYPWDNNMAKYHYNLRNEHDNEQDTAGNVEWMDLPEWGAASHYLDVEMVSTPSPPTPISYTSVCPKNCHLCHAVEKGHWKKVKQIIRKQSSFRSAKARRGKHFGNWYKKHRNVTYYGPFPDAMLASLPSSTGIEVVFNNKQGYHYYYLNWQIGYINPFLSRVNSFLHMVSNLHIKDAKIDYYQLTRMSAW